MHPLGGLDSAVGVGVVEPGQRACDSVPHHVPVGGEDGDQNGSVSGT